MTLRRLPRDTMALCSATVRHGHIWCRKRAVWQVGREGFTLCTQHARLLQGKRP